jgi:hypothetical protein
MGSLVHHIIPEGDIALNRLSHGLWGIGEMFHAIIPSIQNIAPFNFICLKTVTRL